MWFHAHSAPLWSVVFGFIPLDLLDGPEFGCVLAGGSMQFSLAPPPWIAMSIEIAFVSYLPCHGFLQPGRMDGTFPTCSGPPSHPQKRTRGMPRVVDAHCNPIHSRTYLQRDPSLSTPSFRVPFEPDEFPFCKPNRRRSVLDRRSKGCNCTLVERRTQRKTSIRGVSASYPDGNE